MTDLHIPDLSEYQTSIDWPTLAQARPAVILRAHNGRRADRQFAARLVQARRYAQVRLFYGYMVADRDAATQGRELAAIVGPLQPGEAFVCDAEEGAGDQSARVKAYLAALSGRDVVYSGDSFAHDHLAAELKTSGLLFWDAAYRAAEPTTQHFLWQHTDHEATPGVGATDCSIFHGTVQQLRDLLSAEPLHAQATTQPAPLEEPVTDAEIAAIAKAVTDQVITRVMEDATHPHTLVCIKNAVDQVQAGGVDLDALATKVADLLAKRLSS